MPCVQPGNLVGELRKILRVAERASGWNEHAVYLALAIHEIERLREENRRLRQTVEDKGNG